MTRRFRSLYAAAAVSFAAFAVAAGCQSTSPPAEAHIDLREGSGKEALPGRTVTVHYTGWLYDPVKPDKKGREFDSSVGKTPFSFVLGQGQVIPGWDKGVEGMKAGGLRRLVIPPSLAYGKAGAGDVI